MVERSARRRLRAVALVASASSLMGCIVPDNGIRVQEQFDNPGAVRIVQAVPITEQAQAACRDTGQVLACPVPPDTLPFGLVENPREPFCSCPERDANRLFEFDIYVEDPDIDEDESPKDDIYGVFLLDLPAVAVLSDTAIANYVAYTNYLDPTQAAPLAPPSAYQAAIERPAPNLRAWVIGRDSGMDLCNDNDNVALAPGLHTLHLVVTDRSWYVPVERNEADQGRPRRDADEQLVRRADAQPVIGMPDTPGGATYAVASFVFRCYEVGSTPEGVNCNCSEADAS